MTEERRAFTPTKDEENAIYSKMGKEIYFVLKSKFPEESNKDLDAILNSLGAAIIIMIKQNVHEDNYMYVVQLVHKLLTDNLK